MNESYVRLPETIPLRQGDLISVRWFGGRTNESRDLAIIVTADCDIAQNKMGDYYTVIGLIDVHDYIEKIWMKGQIEKRASKEVDNLLKKIRKQQGSNEEEEVDVRALEDWIDSDEPGRIAQRLFPREINSATTQIEWLKQARAVLSGSQGCHKFYLALKRDLDRRNPDAIAKDIEGAIRAMPTEYLFLPALPDSGRDGYVAVLRDIRALERRRIFTSLTQERIRGIDGPTAYRIARLCDPLKYALTQRFGWLFSRVGLATAYEEERDACAEVVAETFREMGDSGGE